MDEDVNVLLVAMMGAIIGAICFALALSSDGIIATICGIVGIGLLFFIVIVIITVISVNLYRWLKDETY